MMGFRLYSLSVIFAISTLYAQPIFLQASATDGTIDSVYKYAKATDGVSGQFNFGTTQGNVHVTDSGLTGYVWGERYGWINLQPTGYGVTNDGEGNLSGYAWGQNIGWINFYPISSGTRVVIDSSGIFSGYAWSQYLGWIVFNCDTNNSCGSGTFKVATDWRPASVRNNPSSGSSGGGGGGIFTPPVTPPPPAPDIPPEPTPAPLPTPEPQPEPTVPPPAPPDVPQSPPPTQPVQVGVINQISSFFGGSSGGGVGIVSSLNEIVSGTVEQVKQSYEFAQQTVVVVAEQTKRVVESPTGSVVTKTVSTVGVVGGGIATASSLFLNPLSFSEIFLIPFRLWGLMLAAFGLKRRLRPWGTVYDSVTKQPLDPAYVVLQDGQGNEVNTSITDLDGRYGFLLAPGTYTIVANKTNYTFPSKKLAGRSADELYSDLYFGEPITVIEAGSVLTKNIPLDPQNFDWNEFAKSQKQVSRFYSKRDLLRRRITDGAFSVGFAVALIAFFAAPHPYNIAIFTLYILLLLLRIFGTKRKVLSSVIEQSTNTPLAFAIIRIYLAGPNQELMHRVTDKFGKFYALVPPGDYYMTIEKKNTDETYTLVKTTSVFSVKNGVIEEHLAV